MKKATKKEIYAKHGIQFENGKIYCDCLDMWVNPLLINGNAKLGKGVYTFSTLPSNKVFQVVINGKFYDIKGACPCDCKGCYAQSGFYNMPSTILSNAVKTYIVRNDLKFFVSAVIAQIEADNVKLVRIHASGDFFCLAYIMAWQNIAIKCKGVTFWTYTKNSMAENAFDGFSNVNVVKSMFKTESVNGFNFGHCDYIEKAYKALKAENKSVHICKCGIDKNQHCNNCTACSKNEYVLFIEHSTDYKAETDASFANLKKLIESQDD